MGRVDPSWLVPLDQVEPAMADPLCRADAIVCRTVRNAGICVPGHVHRQYDTPCTTWNNTPSNENIVYCLVWDNETEPWVFGGPWKGGQQKGCGGPWKRGQQKRVLVCYGGLYSQVQLIWWENCVVPYCKFEGSLPVSFFYHGCSVWMDGEVFWGP